MRSARSKDSLDISVLRIAPKFSAIAMNATTTKITAGSVSADPREPEKS